MVPSVVSAAVLGAVLGSVLSTIGWRVPGGLALPAGRPTARAATGDGRGSPAAAPAGHGGGRGETPRWRAAGVVRRLVLGVVTGGLFAGMTLRFGVTWTLPAYLLLAAGAVLLAVVDLRLQRLPDAIVGPFAAGAVALLVVAAVGQGTAEPLVRALAGGAALFVVYLILAMISPGGLGMGDVKLAGVLGMYLAYLSWRAWILGAAGGFVVVALVGVGLMVAGRASRDTLVPFGPSMLLAAMAAVMLHP